MGASRKPSERSTPPTMSLTAASKIQKVNGEPSELETEVAKALYDLQVADSSKDLGEALRTLHIVCAVPAARRLQADPAALDPRAGEEVCQGGGHHCPAPRAQEAAAQQPEEAAEAPAQPHREGRARGHSGRPGVPPRLWASARATTWTARTRSRCT